MNMISLLNSLFRPSVLSALTAAWSNLPSLTKERIFRSISIKHTPFCWRQQITVSSSVVLGSCCFCYAMCNCTIVRISFIIIICIKMNIKCIVVNATITAFHTSIKFLHIPAQFWLGIKLSVVFWNTLNLWLTLLTPTMQ